MKPPRTILCWQTYPCGCKSPMVVQETELPEKCPKHNESFDQRYMSRVTRPTVEQLESNEPVKI
jgi:hypothetical protein